MMNHITKLLSSFGPKSLPDVPALGHLLDSLRPPREEMRTSHRRWEPSRVGDIVRSKMHQERMLTRCASVPVVGG